MTEFSFGCFRLAVFDGVLQSVQFGREVHAELFVTFFGVRGPGGVEIRHQIMEFHGVNDF